VIRNGGFERAGAPSGRQIELVFGDQRAVVVEVGGGLRSYRASGADVLDGYSRDDICNGARGQLLVPWPNRIRGGRYTFGGVDLQLPLTEPALGNAIHGLARWSAWAIVEASPDRAALSLDLPPQPGYPFQLALGAEYELDARGLTASIRAHNQGREPCPVGFGAHPYVHLGNHDLIDDALLCVPAAATLVSDERGIPTGRVLPVTDTPLDFRSPHRIGSLSLDTAYTQLQPDADGTTRVTLTTPHQRRSVMVWMDGAHRFVMVYTGDTLDQRGRRRRGIAIEPMTCAPDAFNSGVGLRILQPDEQMTTTWGITASGQGGASGERYGSRPTRPSNRS
jgi:aldose 1-epimerase